VLTGSRSGSIDFIARRGPPATAAEGRQDQSCRAGVLALAIDLIGSFYGQAKRVSLDKVFLVP
jgi:hypothetical protein